MAGPGPLRKSERRAVGVLGLPPDLGRARPRAGPARRPHRRTVGGGASRRAPGAAPRVFLLGAPSGPHRPGDPLRRVESGAARHRRPDRAVRPRRGPRGEGGHRSEPPRNRPKGEGDLLGGARGVGALAGRRLRPGRGIVGRRPPGAPPAPPVEQKVAPAYIPKQILECAMTRPPSIRLPVRSDAMLRALFVVAAFLAPLGLPAASSADTTTVSTSATTFDPVSVTIQVGDTVKWVRTSLSHTVTSGFGTADPNVGALFDAPLNLSDPEFTYTFSDTVGTYPYFCRPHELMGMAGTVVVESPLSGIPYADCCDEFTAWGRVKGLFR
ncbi:MAG: hypothetical protein EHM19_09850 [Candidatus Latescibacterota bacterium]|nr:MAG: hypothetical protein EHM19_09850 [Candidatus Latescibacterota bacterium]